MEKRYIYPAIFHVAEEGGYWIEFPDLPMANTQGKIWKMLCLWQKIV